MRRSSRLRMVGSLLMLFAVATFVDATAELRSAVVASGSTVVAELRLMPGGEVLTPDLAHKWASHIALIRASHSLEEALVNAQPAVRRIAMILAQHLKAEDFFDRLLLSGGRLLMLDGLDEVVSREDRGRVRAQVESLVHDIYPGNHVIVAARLAQRLQQELERSIPERWTGWTSMLGRVIGTEERRKAVLRRRIAAATALSRIESGNFGAGSPYWSPPHGEPMWVTVPAGEFWMGTGPDDPTALNTTVVTR